jgi:hypothetical protein
MGAGFGEWRVSFRGRNRREWSFGGRGGFRRGRVGSSEIGNIVCIQPMPRERAEPLDVPIPRVCF